MRRPGRAGEEVGDRVNEGRVCTSASVVILSWCLGNIENLRTNLATIESRDWVEEELMVQAQEHINALNKAVRGLRDHRKQGDKAQ